MTATAASAVMRVVVVVVVAAVVVCGVRTTHAAMELEMRGGTDDGAISGDGTAMIGGMTFEVKIGGGKKTGGRTIGGEKSGGGTSHEETSVGMSGGAAGRRGGTSGGVKVS